MRRYETIVVYSPLLSKDELKAEIQKVKTRIQDHNVSDVFVEEWGRRKIAYNVKKQTHGVYVCFYYETDDTKLLEELVYNLRINDAVLKFQSHQVSAKPAKYRGNLAFVGSSKQDELVASDIEGLEDIADFS